MWHFQNNFKMKVVTLNSITSIILIASFRHQSDIVSTCVNLRWFVFTRIQTTSPIQQYYDAFHHIIQIKLLPFLKIK